MATDFTLFRRRTEVEVAGKVFTLPPFDIEFDFPFSDKSDANNGSLSIYNLSKETLTKLVRKLPIQVRAGYRDFNGTVFLGCIERVKTSPDGVDSKTEITVGDSSSVLIRHRTNKTWKAGIKASQVAKDIIRDMGLTVGDLDFPKDTAYIGGKTFTTGSKTALEELARDCGLKLHINKGLVYMRPKVKGDKTAVLLTYETGLIATPEPVEDTDGKNTGGFKVISLMNHLITTDSIIKIESSTANGWYRVTQGSYKSSSSDHVVEFEVRPT